jgi:hypothetical protein
MNTPATQADGLFARLIPDSVKPIVARNKALIDQARMSPDYRARFERKWVFETLSGEFGHDDA